MQRTKLLALLSLILVAQVARGSSAAKSIATPVSLLNGGTGTSAASANAAFNALSPLTTSGDLLYGGASGAGTRRAVGSTGDVLTVSGGLPTWAAPATSGTVTSVAMTVPSLLSVSGSPITSSGTLALTYSGTALPVVNGGTGVTSSTGTGSVVLGTSPTITNATLSIDDPASAFSLAITNDSTLSANRSLLIGTNNTTRTVHFNRDFYVNTGTVILSAVDSGGSDVIVPAAGTLATLAGAEVLTNKTISGASNTLTVRLANDVTGVLPLVNGGTGTAAASANAALNALLPTQTSNSGKVLTTNGTDSSWTSAATGTVTSVAMTVPTFLSVAGTPVTTSGTLAVTLSGTALPVANGGTGLTSGTSGGVPYYSGSTTIASSGALTASAIVLGGGSGSSPTSLALGTANQILSMNTGATANEYRTLATGTSGTDFAVAFGSGTTTLNLPDTGSGVRGVVSTGAQSFFGAKTFNSGIVIGGNTTGDSNLGTISSVTNANYYTGTFTANFNVGMSTATNNVTVQYALSGKTVTLWFPDTSNITATASTGSWNTASGAVPSAIRPQDVVRFPIITRTNGATATIFSVGDILTDGTIETSATTTWVNTQTNNGFKAITTTYKIN